MQLATELETGKNGNGKKPRIEIPAATERTVTIKPAKMGIITFNIKGTAPYLQCRFPAKAMAKMMATQAAGSQAKSKVARQPRDFDDDFKGAMHMTTEGKHGMPASAFRAACISACRIVGFKMTLAKLGIFIEADGFDVVDNTPLIYIAGKPKRHEMIGRNDNGSCDIRIRAVWDAGWKASLRIRFDEEMFSATDIYNLITRVGQQVGIGEGRPDSRNSAGMGMGLFEIESTGK